MKSIPVSKISSTSKAIRRLGTRTAKASQTLALRLPSRNKVASGIKVSAALAATLGSSVPYMQGIAGAVTQIITHVDAVQSNKEQFKEIAEQVLETANTLVIAVDGVDESHMDEPLRVALAELEWRLEMIGASMQRLRKRSFLQRLVSKDDDAKSLSEHRQGLQRAMENFKLKQLVRVRCELAAMTSNLHVATRGSSSSKGDKRVSPLSAFFFPGITTTPAIIATADLAVHVRPSPTVGASLLTDTPPLP